MAFKGALIFAAFLTVANSLPSQCSIILSQLYLLLFFLHIKLFLIYAKTMAVAEQGYVY